MPLPKTSGLQLNTAGLISSFSLLIKREHLMRSHYEVSIYYRVIAGALGAGEISNFTALLGSWEPAGCELHWGRKRSSEHFWMDLRLLHQGPHRLMSSFLKVLGFQNMFQSDYFDWLFIISITITPTCSSFATASRYCPLHHITLRKPEAAHFLLTLLGALPSHPTPFPLTSSVRERGGKHSATIYHPQATRTGQQTRDVGWVTCTKGWQF